ncbi:hypothetical protein TBLA_0I02400 [Henningerozyma blattae CBS 6284]|uniref:Protein kinase domain-containing protein n=1 Tax=Henningerozyma blattae (strain ATCC 34711 / CBS 6284 / DSM 70876 / NBRC 10599 / NRRL Y-10934 / UCD 77-7) TaxID=1071380 RepID=I2H946_HENB6|nr:hypothetical protein TBLA_0I02400 [Tetrapisispora blattae CBS 6284]CCH62898.1 hypothetical protein TBLA_0I02400 [Tetrapisispora blattae CBS 6284]
MSSNHSNTSSNLNSNNDSNTNINITPATSTTTTHSNPGISKNNDNNTSDYFGYKPYPNEQQSWPLDHRRSAGKVWSPGVRVVSPLEHEIVYENNPTDSFSNNNSTPTTTTTNSNYSSGILYNVNAPNRSNSARRQRSHSNAKKTISKVHEFTQGYNSYSNDSLISSTNSMRRPSWTSPMNVYNSSLDNNNTSNQNSISQLNLKHPSTLLKQQSPGKHDRNTQLSSPGLRNNPWLQESFLSTPTLIVPPEIASLTTQSTSDVPPQQLRVSPSRNSSQKSTGSNHSNANTPVSPLASNNDLTLPEQYPNSTPNSNKTDNTHSTTPTTSTTVTSAGTGSASGTIVHNNSSSTNSNNNTNPINEVVNHSKQDNLSPSSSTRSVPKINTSSSNMKLSKKQHLLNEQLYLEKMKNYVSHDYYTRGIVPSSTNDEEDDFESDIEDIVDLTNDDKQDFGTNFFTANKDIVAMSSKFLLHRLQWLKQADPRNAVVQETFDVFDLKGESTNNEQENKKEITAKLLDNQDLLSLLADHPLVLERFEWQTMLSNVLKGDIVKSEKTKIANQVKPRGSNTHYAEEIWLELKAWMTGKTVDEMKRTLKILRISTDSFFKKVLVFRLPDDIDMEEGKRRIKDITDRYYRVINFWCNLKQMYQDKPITNSSDLISRIDVMNSWLNFTHNFDINIKVLRKWVGDENVKVLFSHEVPENGADFDYQDGRAFVEQIMKEKDIESIFQKKIFYPLAPWILKAKLFSQNYSETMKELNLRFPDDQLELLLLFPIRFIKEIILIRLAYAKKLKKPTMMMIDQMIDDFTSYIRLSVQMKYTLTTYREDVSFLVRLDPDFDNIVMEAIKYLFRLLELKLFDSTKVFFKTFKEPDELYKYWEELKNVGHYIEGAGFLIVKEFNKISLRLLHRLHSYLLQQQNSPPNFSNRAEAEKWVVQMFEYSGSIKRKLNRFTNVLTKASQNSVNFKVENHNALLSKLKETGHFLIFTGGELEQNGLYLLGSSELLGCQDEDIFRILKNSDIGCDMIPKLEIRNSLSLYNAAAHGYGMNSLLGQGMTPEGLSYYYVQNEEGTMPFQPKGNKGQIDLTFDHYHDSEEEMFALEQHLRSLGYLLIICPGEPMLWEGDMYNLSGDTILGLKDFNFEVTKDYLLLMSQGSCYALEYQCERLQRITDDSISFIERRCSFPVIESNLQKINKAYFRVTYNVLNNLSKVLTTFKKVCPGHELLNSVFLFARDYGKNFLRMNVATYEKKSIIILLMMNMSVQWLSFLLEDCDPTDQRTFRWCVPAMEFAMQITNGWNILGLDEKQFSALKQKISACMSLLISHFDVMGARANEAEKIFQMGRPNIDFANDIDDEYMLKINSDLRVQAINDLETATTRNPHQIGKVLDDTDKGNKYLLSLASSMSNVQIRWQKRKFIGSGTFGNVFSAVNLDSGDVLAVKEIKIQDTKAMKKVFPLIKKEMTVLEMLNHPNIVQYYGVEVHRDKVNIFMEYCEGGSLASLLEHGRIEDEMVTQVYTLELLEGLSYLHQSGIVHRDIKPENILLDFNGIIKYVDFGAARKIAKDHTRIASFSKDGKDNKESKKIDDTLLETEEAGVGTGLYDMVGTPMYMAPEAISGSPNKNKFGSDDVWSLGCVVLEMITGRRPWANLDNEWAIMYHVAAGHSPQLPSKDEVSTNGNNFLKRCLQQDPYKRATAVDLLMDVWIVEIRELAFGTGEPDTAATTSSATPDESKQ